VTAPEWEEPTLPFGHHLGDGAELEASKHRHPTNRLRVVRHGTRKPDKVHEVFCVVCGTRLVVGDGHDAVEALELASRNASARPCCEAWNGFSPS